MTFRRDWDYPEEPRLRPARPDVAATHLEQSVDAKRFTPGTEYQVTSSVLPIRRTPADDGPQETQALFGETFTIYDEADGWGWGQAAIDGYVGYVAMEGLSAPVHEATHRVSALRTYRFSEPDLKSAPYGLIARNAVVTAEGVEGAFVQEARGGWVFGDHLTSLGSYTDDPVDVALGYLGAPYFWGGRESLGLDCSALIQNAFQACGLIVPRDADLQERYFAEQAGDVLFDADQHPNWRVHDLKRGDLIFWPGHVAVMLTPLEMLHANATHMAVTIDPLDQLSERCAKQQDLHLRRIVRPKR